MVEPGEKRCFGVPVGEYANCAEVKLPVMAIQGAEDGPCFWINGEVHGEEINGSAAAWELFLELDPTIVKGTLVITPIANPIAFVDRVKVSYIDFLDMDTTFPGNPGGQWTQRLAYILFEEIKQKANYVLSMHSQATKYAGEPYTVFKNVPGADPRIVEMSQNLALNFGTRANCRVDIATAAGELHGVTSGALDISCIHLGIPAFMAELGPGGRLTRPYIEQTKQGILNTMAYLRLIEREVVPYDGQQILITQRAFWRSPHGGMMKCSYMKPGNIIKQGETMAEFHYFTEKVWDFKALCDCYIINCREHPVINTGERIAFVGTKWSQL